MGRMPVVAYGSRRYRRAARVAIVGVGGMLALLLAGCSQVAAIAPVGGDHLAEVRYAAIDVLLAEDVELLTAPDCAQAASGEVTCTGQTLDGAQISVVSPADDQTVLTVSVGDRELYSGSIMKLIDEAARNG
jgi:hypothetical protein